MSRAGPSRKALSKKGWTKVVKEAIALVGIVCQENGFAKNLLHPLRGWSIYQKGSPKSVAAWYRNVRSSWNHWASTFLGRSNNLSLSSW
jgi:hypothetical protein